MYFKIHDSYRKVIAICDEDILGKKFEEGKKQLDLRENFYKGVTMAYEEVVREMIRLRKEDATFNIAGKEAVKAAFEAGIIDEENVGKVDNVPFALVLL